LKVGPGWFSDLTPLPGWLYLYEMNKTAIIILGASGDLSHRKLIPALAALWDRERLHECTAIIGSGRTVMTHEEFRVDFDSGDSFKKHLYYHQGFEGLREFVDSLGTFGQIIFFFSLPPAVYTTTARRIHELGFRENVRIIIEKPFGMDYESARSMNRDLRSLYNEKNIYRIDHYLAKEAVQNILVFRFANSLFEPVWNSRYIESIQINAYEELGVENRGAYFDKSGIIRDMIQNHLFQLLSLMTMEAPVSLDPDDICMQKTSILKALRVERVARAQYEGYREEPKVSKDSKTETYAELELYIDNFRWTGMPIYIRTGKALDRKGTEIGIKFKELPRLLFNSEGNLKQNQIIFNIQPAAGIILDVSTKIPGTNLEITNTNMNFCFSDSFTEEIPEAYQRLLLDAIIGDKTLYVSADETEISWKKIEPFLDKGDLATYKRASVPDNLLGIKWIDFENYTSMCLS